MEVLDLDEIPSLDGSFEIRKEVDFTSSSIGDMRAALQLAEDNGQTDSKDYEALRAKLAKAQARDGRSVKERGEPRRAFD